MTDELAPDAGSDPVSPAPPRPRRSRPFVLGGAGLVVLATLGAVGGLAARDVLDARAHLLRAESVAGEIRADAVAGRLTQARDRLPDLQADVRAARGSLGGWQLSVAAAVPGLGQNVSAVRTVAAQIDVLATQVAPPLVGAATGVEADGSGGRLAPLVEAAPAVVSASERVDGVRERLDRVRREHLLGPVRSGVDRAVDGVDSLAGLLSTARTAAEIGAPALGADGPRRYLLVFQNSAEARGTGGLPGAFAVLRADGRDVRIERTGALQDLKSPARMPFDPGAGYTALYGDDPTLWPNMGMSPQFPTAARLMLHAWLAQYGERLDGVIATDPVALGYLLDASGPVTLADGEVLHGRDVAPLTMSGVYRRWPGGAQDAVRDRYLTSVSVAVFERMLQQRTDLVALARATRRALDEHRLALYAADPSVQSRISGTPLSGALPTGPGPFLAVVTNEGNANKLDYYLDRTVRYDLGCSTGSTRRTRVTVTLRNTAPASGLPEYVAGGGSGAYHAWEIVTSYVTPGARLANLALDGTSVEAIRGEDAGHPAYRVDVDLAPGQSRTVVLDLVEPASREHPDVWVQPLARPQATTVRDACASS